MTAPDGLVLTFRVNVVAQMDAILRGDAVSGNAHAEKYLEAFDRIREMGDQARDALASLFEDESVHVRVAAAAFLLRHCGASARAVLEREAAIGSGLSSLQAAEALKRWDEGTWSLDPI